MISMRAKEAIEVVADRSTAQPESFTYLSRWTMSQFRWAIVAILIGPLAGCGFIPWLGNLPLIESNPDVLDAGSPTPPVTSDCLGLGQPRSDLHQSLLDAVNQYRAEHGLNPLIYSQTLEAEAETYVRDMSARNFFSHVDPDGHNPGDRALTAGFCHKYVGENLAAGQRSVEAVMAAWEASPGHNANLLDPDYVYVGVGIFVDGSGRPYWSENYAFDVP